MNDNKIEYNSEGEKLQSYINLVAKSQERLITFETTLKYFGDLKNKTIVDFGCGPGFFLKICSENGAKSVTGIDIAAAMVEIAKSNFAEKSDFFVHDCFESLPQHYNDKFDLASAIFVLHFASNYSEFKTFLSNMFNVLKSGGKTVIVVPNMKYNDVDRQVVAQTFGYLMPPEIFMRQLEEGQRYGANYMKKSTDTNEYLLDEICFSWEFVKWTEETILKTMTDIGFVDLEQLDPSISKGDLDENVRKAVNTFVLLFAARKPC